jgi:aminopeptidase
MEPYDRLLESYARLVVRVGVNVQLGQRVEIHGEVEHAPVARALARAAYDAGAGLVSVAYVDQHVLRAQIDAGRADGLGRVLPHELEGIRAWEKDRPAIIKLAGNANPGLMTGLDPARLVASQRVELMQAQLSLIFSNAVAWTVVAAPSPGWAEMVFGTADLAALWDAVATAMRLDEEDPARSWRDHLAALALRRDLLNDRGFDRVRFRGPGTDLTVGLAPQSRWVTAQMTNADGTDFVANMPTEEVYVSPDWRRADGVAQTTAPFFLMGTTFVDGLRLELRDGEVAQATALVGEDAVRRQLASIPRARHLGEVAVVDGGSRVRRTGLTFADMLYDENAGSHIAWGNGFPTTFPGAVELTTQQRIDAGLNQSATHVDVVVGGAGVELDGIAADGTATPILRGDTFVLDQT